ncbi:hypothetical protein MOQ72_21910 [Saccharopolyspora sp. K220]|uniref:hypothetical protein n=1 Tax=Saccharopolyspora soli TaxID=2926618 RepID=UPI001F572A90|nr:hypothetical protein [Saccharopolyspora soli]MCI2420102.1 hypothetical protein [Saccharopolyspora soli]
MTITMTSHTTNSVVERPSLRDLADARTHYEEQFGWPVAMKVEQELAGRAWTFLTQPNAAMPVLSSTLDRLKVHPVPRRALLLRTDNEAWIESPQPRHPLLLWFQMAREPWTSGTDADFCGGRAASDGNALPRTGRVDGVL